MEATPLSKRIFMVMISAFVLVCLSFSRSGAGFALGSVAGFSSTNVAGPIEANTTWTLAGSPYVVSADVLVIVDVFLTIEPGVVVRFANGTSIIVDGSLVARGNPSQMITFTSNASSPAHGDWESIRTRTGGSISIDWTTVEYSGQGIETRSDSNISHCVFRGNNIGVLGSNASIIHCTFENNFNGVNVTSSSIADSEFYNNTEGIMGSGNVQDSSVYNNSKNGISGVYYSANGINDYVYLGSVANCSIHNNGGDGVAACSVTDCLIYDNGGIGVSAFSVTNCSVYDNGGTGIVANSSVNNCLVFENSDDGIFGGVFGRLSGSDTNCTVHDNGGNGVSAYSVANCQVYNNNGTGISAGFVTNCSVSGNRGDGVSGDRISGSSISDNEGIGVRIRWWTGGGAAVSTCDIYDNLAGGVRFEPMVTSHVNPDESSGLVENSRIHGNLFGVLVSCAGGLMDAYRDVTISGCNISYNLKNGIMTDESWDYYIATISLRVLNTTIDSNGRFGISLNMTVPAEHRIIYFPIYEITNCMITNHTVGAVGTFGKVAGSTIANNSQVGVDVFDVTGGMNQNNIYDNGLYNIVNHVQFGKDINATQNWWGTTNKTLIEAYIFDYSEDYNLSRVIVEPFSTSPIPEFPSFFALPLFMAAMLLAVIGYRRKRINVHLS